ncbi:uncharacterized protein LOC115626382 [Scaptodrosophila lebanonensis]|uniref:Uncharacterized protein LOC115626382 n=1 Tax=Drosophila lebanonensis TaxID=7225 RepID=A0A6J2TM05_DROLE|nr:uncharacterized protein LOC115626382 [Scaptodrosophila lebanonensis]
MVVKNRPVRRALFLYSKAKSLHNYEKRAAKSLRLLRQIRVVLILTLRTVLEKRGREESVRKAVQVQKSLKKHQKMLTSLRRSLKRQGRELQATFQEDRRLERKLRNLQQKAERRINLRTFLQTYFADIKKIIDSDQPYNPKVQSVLSHKTQNYFLTERNKSKDLRPAVQMLQNALNTIAKPRYKTQRSVRFHPKSKKMSYAKQWNLKDSPNEQITKSKARKHRKINVGDEDQVDIPDAAESLKTSISQVLHPKKRMRSTKKLNKKEVLAEEILDVSLPKTRKSLKKKHRKWKEDPADDVTDESYWKSRKRLRKGKKLHKKDESIYQMANMQKTLRKMHKRRQSKKRKSGNTLEFNIMHFLQRLPKSDMKKRRRQTNIEDDELAPFLDEVNELNQKQRRTLLGEQLANDSKDEKIKKRKGKGKRLPKIRLRKDNSVDAESQLASYESGGKLSSLKKQSNLKTAERILNMLNEAANETKLKSKMKDHLQRMLLKYKTDAGNQRLLWSRKDKKLLSKIELAVKSDNVYKDNVHKSGKKKRRVPLSKTAAEIENLQAEFETVENIVRKFERNEGNEQKTEEEAEADLKKLEVKVKTVEQLVEVLQKSKSAMEEPLDAETSADLEKLEEKFKTVKRIVELLNKAIQERKPPSESIVAAELDRLYTKFKTMRRGDPLLKSFVYRRKHPDEQMPMQDQLTTGKSTDPSKGQIGEVKVSEPGPPPHQKGKQFSISEEPPDVVPNTVWENTDITSIEDITRSSDLSNKSDLPKIEHTKATEKQKSSKKKDSGKKGTIKAESSLEPVATVDNVNALSANRVMKWNKTHSVFSAKLPVTDLHTKQETPPTKGDDSDQMDVKPKQSYLPNVQKSIHNDVGYKPAQSSATEENPQIPVKKQVSYVTFSDAKTEIPPVPALVPLMRSQQRGEEESSDSSLTSTKRNQRELRKQLALKREEENKLMNKAQRLFQIIVSQKVPPKQSDIDLLNEYGREPQQYNNRLSLLCARFNTRKDKEQRCDPYFIEYTYENIMHEIEEAQRNQRVSDELRSVKSLPLDCSSSNVQNTIFDNEYVENLRQKWKNIFENTEKSPMELQLAAMRQKKLKEMDMAEKAERQRKSLELRGIRARRPLSALYSDPRLTHRMRKVLEEIGVMERPKAPRRNSCPICGKPNAVKRQHSDNNQFKDVKSTSTMGSHYSASEHYKDAKCGLQECFTCTQLPGTF